MKKSRILICPACDAIRNGVKSRIAFRHTCGKEPAQPQPGSWLPSNPKQGNPYGIRQTKIDEHLDEMRSELSPEDFDRIVSNTEEWHKRNYGIGYKED